MFCAHLFLTMPAGYGCLYRHGSKTPGGGMNCLKMEMVWRWCMAMGCLCLGAGMAGQAGAHPHEFIDTRLVVHLDDRGIDGFHQYWTFDDLILTP